jgi:hypothetical protein
MIDRFLARLHEAWFGVPFMSAVVSLVMSTHWAPMALPSLAVLVVCVVRPHVGTHPAVWALMACLWAAALFVVPERMEDHVPLFTIWLVALAICLGRGRDRFLDEAGFQARVLLGVTFTAAVVWKVVFGTYLDGVTMWTFMVADERFRPLSAAVGLTPDRIATDRSAISSLLAGEASSVPFDASGWTVAAIVLVSVGTLLLEALIAASHLAPDSSAVARLRLPSIVVFGTVTYGVVPVLPFALLLALFAMIVAGWRRNVMWVLPLFMVVIAVRTAVLAF